MMTLVLDLVNNEIFITGMLMLNQMSGAFIDVVVDALMVT
jgi:hypothetical protein